MLYIVSLTWSILIGGVLRQRASLTTDDSVEESPLSLVERQLPYVIIIIILVMYIYSHDITKLVGAFPSERSPSYLIGYVNVSWNNR